MMKYRVNSATVTWDPMNQQLGFSYTLMNDAYAAGCGSLCLGGLLIIPFALKYCFLFFFLLHTFSNFDI